ncbi:MAG: hypothetical protein A2Z25_22840 [Planctomycetes bacterium RBG_16_55_9]|nr:MAG: hypothetical protein A2Z25_22840 [Planctomycetes bacterium RBG_16_55_9]
MHLVAIVQDYTYRHTFYAADIFAYFTGINQTTSCLFLAFTKVFFISRIGPPNKSVKNTLFSIRKL